MQVSSAARIRVEQVSLTPRVLTSGKAGFSQTPTNANYLLKHISFEVRPGDRVAVVGASGAGKTSLLRLLNRLSEPTSGVIYLNDVALNQWPTTQLRQQVVLVLQESKLLGMTVQQALEYPLVLRKLAQRVIQQRVQDWSDRLRIPSEWLNRTELQLSVGQRQVVAIARALATEPSVLLLDEPTAALDVGRSELVLRAITDLAQTQGTAVLMANHQLELAAQFCDRVLHLDRGMLVQNLPAIQMDWSSLRQSLMQAEVHQAEEWGD